MNTAKIIQFPLRKQSIRDKAYLCFLEKMEKVEWSCSSQKLEFHLIASFIYSFEYLPTIEELEEKIDRLPKKQAKPIPLPSSCGSCPNFIANKSQKKWGKMKIGSCNIGYKPKVGQGFTKCVKSNFLWVMDIKAITKEEERRKKRGCK